MHWRHLALRTALPGESRAALQTAVCSRQSRPPTTYHRRRTEMTRLVRLLMLVCTVAAKTIRGTMALLGMGVGLRVLLRYRRGRGAVLRIGSFAPYMAPSQCCQNRGRREPLLLASFARQ